MCLLFLDALLKCFLSTYIYGLSLFIHCYFKLETVFNYDFFPNNAIEILQSDYFWPHWLCGSWFDSGLTAVCLWWMFLWAQSSLVADSCPLTRLMYTVKCLFTEYQMYLMDTCWAPLTARWRKSPQWKPSLPTSYLVTATTPSLSHCE